MQKVDIYLERKNVFPYFVSPFSNCVENVVDDHRHTQEALQLIYFPVWIAAMENKKYSLAGWRAVSEEGAQPLTWVPPSQGEELLVQQPGAGTAQQSQASHRTSLSGLGQGTLSGWARICLFPSLGLYKKISPAGRETSSVFQELYQVLAKEIRTLIRFLCSSCLFWCVCMNTRLV